MKVMTKRIFAFLLVLALSLSLLPAVEFSAQAATVDYVYAGNYIKNWGTRGTTATFMSPNAEKFYEDNNTSYEELARLSGSTSTSSVPSSALYRELKDLMTSNHSYKTGYDATKDLYQHTDCQNSGKTSSKISSFYSGTLIGPAWDSGSTWNREHTWPDSKGLGGQDENDIMMLRPTSKSENSSRGNTAYGESGDYYDPNKYGMSLHGDVARIMLYQYVRWGNTSYMWGKSGVMESREVLLRWMEEDPVDTWELGRNDSVESITGTRNVFVDYPELAFVLFGADIPENYTTPSGGAAASSYTITAISNNTAWGTVSVSGRNINASAKTGYAISGYTIVSGNAEVVRSGNSFIVTASSNVTVRINFAPRTQNTVKFSQQGSIVDSATAYTGDDITLPAHKGAVESSYNFVGWVSNVVEETATMPTFHTAGSKYTVSGDATLYALYSRFEGGSGSTSNVFEPYSGTLTEGDYIIVGEGSEGDGAMVAADTGKTRLQYTMVTYTDGDILSPTADMIWHIGADGSYWTVYNAATGKYAGSSGSKNQAKLLDTVEDATKWTATGTSTYELKNKANSAKGINANLRRNGSVGFACYSTATGKPLKLYKRVAGTIYYFTGAAEIGCNHPDAYNVAGKAPTCTEPGYTAGVYCPDCEEYISGHEDLEALNHENAYDVDGKEPTCTEPGYTAGVYCPDCEEFLSGAEEIAASGHDFDTNGVCTVCGAAIGMPGDVNGDGEINTLDGLMLLRHLNDWQVNIAVPNAMDVNADGEVNSLDGLMLMRYLNGWEVTLGKTN